MFSRFFLLLAFLLCLHFLEIIVMTCDWTYFCVLFEKAAQNPVINRNKILFVSQRKAVKNYVK